MSNVAINKKIQVKGNYVGETKKRSIVKTVIYRIIIIIADFLFLYLVTRKLAIAIGFMVISNLYTMVSYYFYERAWDHITWGKVLIKAKRKKK